MPDIDALDFTRASEEKFYNAVDLNDFKNDDAEVIFNCLQDKLHSIPFGDYLKRYIYKKAGMSGEYNNIDLKIYQQIIASSFKETDTPKSFTETSAKLSALSKNWLTQASVARQTVFLLGFGLSMGIEDVSEFLVKAQRERSFNFKDPNEIIFWYCLKKKFRFTKAMQLRSMYDELAVSTDSSIYEDQTNAVRSAVQKISEEQYLMDYLSRFKSDRKQISISITTNKWFTELYLKSKEIIAGFLNRDELEKIEIQVNDYKTANQNSEKLSKADKEEQINKIKASRRIYTTDDVSESDVEKVLCCGTPSDKSGNLTKLSASKLAKHFSNKRFSRQHVSELLAGKVPVDRFDLITLNFFIFSQDESIKNNKVRYSRFIDSTNLILNDCSMGELFVSNPYECFLLMCTLTDEPLATYADVVEMSYSA